LKEDHKGKVLAGEKDASKINAEERYIPPTIILNPSEDSKMMQEEIFGPILPIKTFSHIDEAITYITSKPKPLACYYFGSSFFHSNKAKIEKKISAGGMVFNDVLLHVVNPDLPFGGVGASGYGKYHSELGFKNMSNAKAVLTKFPSNIYPYNSFYWPFTNH